MTRKIPGFKNVDGQYEPVPKVEQVQSSPAPSPDVSLDDIGKKVITALERAVSTLLSNITDGDVSRDAVGALKDCSTMLKDLKKDEKDYLDGLTDEQLERLK